MPDPHPGDQQEHQPSAHPAQHGQASPSDPPRHRRRHRHRHRHGNHPHDGPPRRRRRHWVWIILLIIVVLIVVIVLRRPKPKKAPPSPGIPVGVAPVRQGNLDVTLDALGTVTPVYTVTVSSRAAGELTAVHYREGQDVKQGDLLAEIDPRPYQAAVNQVEGQLARDQATLKNARLDLTRYQNAFRQHAISEQQVATQQATVEQDQGLIRIDQANLDTARLNLSYARITAPIAGRIGLRTVDPGNLVAANSATGLLTIAQLEPITVIFTLAEDEIGDVAQQAEAGRTLRVDALDRDLARTLASGTLITLDNQINSATGTVRGRAQFANAHHELFPNQFVNARLYVKTLANVDLVPAAAIQRTADQTLVYVVNAGQAESHPVRVTTIQGETAAVTGVKPGDTVIVEGFDKLQNGSKVIVRQPGRKPPAAGAAPEPRPKPKTKRAKE